MIEIYLFIHPLCPDCLVAERKILELIKNEHKKIHFRFVPFLNLHSFQLYLKENHIYLKNIETRNNWFRASYSASLDYKAIQLQGKKKGRLFLLTLQEAILEKEQLYSQSLVDTIIQEIGGDLSMFYADRRSKLVIESFQADQRTAREMGIIKGASAVVFNYACDRDFGVLVENYLSKDILHDLLKTSSEQSYDKTTFQMSYGEHNQALEQQTIAKQHLHILK